MLYNSDVPYYLTVKIYNVFKDIKVKFVNLHPHPMIHMGTRPKA